jgi:hypothetical protein
MDLSFLQISLIVATVLGALSLIVWWESHRNKREHVRGGSVALQPDGEFQAPVRLVVPHAARVAQQPPAPPRIVERPAAATPQVVSRPPETKAPSTALQTRALVLPPVTIDAALWELLLANRPRQLEAPAAASSKPAPIAAVSAAFEVIGGRAQSPVFPVGMLDEPALREVIENDRPFTGLVMSIGINDSDAEVWHRQGLMQSVAKYIGGLLDNKDFGCRTGYDEFLMVCPGQQGAEAQRRLNQISERLWDYQLRGLGTSAILFSWGGVQVRNEPLGDAIQSAKERMQQTKRGNAPIAINSVAARSSVG